MDTLYSTHVRLNILCHHITMVGIGNIDVDVENFNLKANINNFNHYNMTMHLVHGELCSPLRSFLHHSCILRQCLFHTLPTLLKGSTSTLIKQCIVLKGRYAYQKYVVFLILLSKIYPFIISLITFPFLFHHYKSEARSMESRIQEAVRTYGNDSRMD